MATGAGSCRPLVRLLPAAQPGWERPPSTKRSPCATRASTSVWCPGWRRQGAVRGRDPGRRRRLRLRAVGAGRSLCRRPYRRIPSTNPPQGRYRARSRGGVDRGLAALVEAALAAEAEGTVRVVGLWSHLAHADAPRHPIIDRQLATFRDALGSRRRRGVRPEVRHLANSAATLSLPDTHFDLVRPGVSVYGLSPGPDVGEFDRTRAATGNDTDGQAGDGQARACRSGGVVRPSVRHVGRDDARTRAAGLCRRDSAASEATWVRCGLPGGGARSLAPCAWIR